MRRLDCLKMISGLVTDELVVVGMTGTHWEWNSLLPDYEGNVKVCSMGNFTAFGLGMALALPQRGVIVLDSDGSTLFDLATLTTLGTYLPGNLTVFVFDNEAYSGSRISEPSATAFRTNIEEVARATGISSAITVRDLAAFDQCSRASIGSNELSYIVAKVEEDPSARDIPKPTRDYLERKYRFVRYVERSERRSVFRSFG